MQKAGEEEISRIAQFTSKKYSTHPSFSRHLPTTTSSGSLVQLSWDGVEVRLSFLCHPLTILTVQRNRHPLMILTTQRNRQLLYNILYYYKNVFPCFISCKDLQGLGAVR